MQTSVKIDIVQFANGENREKVLQFYMSHKK